MYGPFLVRTAPVAVVVAVLSCALLLSAASAHASVSAPQPVSPRGLLVQQSAVAAGGHRTAVLMAGYRAPARRRDFSLHARLGNATSLGRLQRLASGDVHGPQVTVGADGTAVAAWAAHPRPGTTLLRVAIARPGQDFGAVQTLSHAPSIMLGGVGVTAQGRAVVAWRPGTSGTPVQVAVAAPGRRFAAAQTLGDSRYYEPTVTVAPNGTVFVAWLQTPSPPLPPPAPPPPTRTARVLAATLAQDAATFAPATELGSLDSWYGGPYAASGPGGAAVTWRQIGYEKRLVSLTTRNTFQPASALPPSRYDAEKGDHLALGFPVDGTNVALWRKIRTRTAEDSTETFAAVNSSIRPPGGAFSPATQISTKGWLAGPPQTADLSDRTIATWSETAAARARLRIAARPAGQGWKTLHFLRTPGIYAYTVGAAAARRYAVVAWIQHHGPSAQSGDGHMYLATYRP
jgi:hypothetical protein